MVGVIAGLGLPLRGLTVEVARETSGGFRVTQGGQPAGGVAARAVRGWLVIDSLCIEAGRRGRGVGSEVVSLLLQAAGDAGFGGVRAWAPAEAGLAVYFWLRCGLRPAARQAPGPGLWFERRLGV